MTSYRIDFSVKHTSFGQDEYYNDTLYYDDKETALRRVAELKEKYGEDLKSLYLIETTKII